MYVAGGGLYAVPFDVNRLEARGTQTPVVVQVATTAAGAADFDISRNGTLVYVPGGVAGTLSTLVWIDRQGHETPVGAPVRGYLYPRISPNGEQVALDIRDQENDIWIWNFAQSRLIRVTFDPAVDRFPVWTPDGRVIFSSDRAGIPNLFEQRVDASASTRRLTESGRAQLPMAVSPDGSRLVLRDGPDLASGQDLLMMSLDGGATNSIARTPAEEANAEISPDGRWIAYQSNESGQEEIYVRPFPRVDGGKWRVSIGGGRQPLWSSSGTELFFLTAEGALMRVEVRSATTWSSADPTVLLDAKAYLGAAVPLRGRTYDIARDGQRFLMIKPAGVPGEASPGTMLLVQHFDEELKRLVPTN